ncbi:LuxR C-terminal-related transcriptional regulator [Gordonia neofelifaecis]|uniref:LuxR family transcriptional regulator n=1 Tax=Gordonia neofelifaecis NRRL B-59395 TaxID=644548 RepID=F1YPM3_9ACTN|nr:LuxR C-terminal-related transcriptional regulator [Gordonia neofelifaecis]EGD53368.1 LuxR family transcriptional regulator [Gordonia neofelifaecis NRRL B-59395]
MIIDAACVGRESELSELTGRIVGAEGPEFILITAPSGGGKSTVLRRLSETLRGRGVRVAGGAEHDPASLFDGAPAVLLIDDADRSDPNTLHRLHELADARPDAPVSTVLTADAATSAIADLLPDTMRLPGLDRSAVAEIALRRGRAVHPSLIDELTRHTAGRPREIVELLDELPDRLWSRADASLPAPRRVVAEVRAGLAECRPETRSLIEAIAVLNAPESLGAAVRLAGVNDVLAAVDEAVGTGLVRPPAAVGPAASALAPASPVVRAAIVEVIGPRRAGLMHERAAELVDDPARSLHHRVAATPIPDPNLADEIAELADARGSAGEWAEAAELYREAGRLTEEPLRHAERVTRSVDSLLADGDCLTAASMVPTVESLRETPLRNATLAYLAILRGRSAEARIRLDRAWGIVSFEREPDIAALIAQRYVLHCLVRCQGERLVGWADRAVDMAGTTSPAGVEAAVIRGLGQAWAGRVDEAVTSYDDLLRDVRFGAQAQRVAVGHGWLQLGLDHVDTARASLETAVSMVDLGGSKRITLWALGWLARLQFVTGDWDTALETVAQSNRVGAASGITLATPLADWTAAQIHCLRGDPTAAEDAVTHSSRLAGDYEIMQIPLLLARAQIAEAAADYNKVTRILSPLRMLAPDTPALTEPGWWPWVDVLANALVLDGRHDDADALLRPHEARADERGHRSAGARLRYARGRHLGAIGDIVSARRKFEEALELLDGLLLRHDQARVNFAYGQTLRRAGKRRAADTVMGNARDIYRSLGATAYVERCDRELKAGGLHALRNDRSSFELTPQEESVTALVTSGLTNREVAAELYISPKTVQYHLTRIYAKLGVRSRSELTALRR